MLLRLVAARNAAGPALTPACDDGDADPGQTKSPYLTPETPQKQDSPPTGPAARRASRSQAIPSTRTSIRPSSFRCRAEAKACLATSNSTPARSYRCDHAQSSTHDSSDPRVKKKGTSCVT